MAFIFHHPAENSTVYQGNFASVSIQISPCVGMFDSFEIRSYKGSTLHDEIHAGFAGGFCWGGSQFMAPPWTVPETTYGTDYRIRLKKVVSSSVYYGPYFTVAEPQDHTRSTSDTLSLGTSYSSSSSNPETTTTKSHTIALSDSISKVFVGNYFGVLSDAVALGSAYATAITGVNISSSKSDTLALSDSISEVSVGAYNRIR